MRQLLHIDIAVKIKLEVFSISEQSQCISRVANVLPGITAVLYRETGYTPETIDIKTYSAELLTPWDQRG
jgi:hypothetical protein